MARSELIVCDVCGISKKTTNHWFVIHVHYMDALGDRIWKISLVSHESKYIGTEGKHIEQFDICGEADAIKKISELMSKIQSND